MNKEKFFFFPNVFYSEHFLSFKFSFLVFVVGGSIRPSGVKVEFSDLAFRLTCRCDLSEDEQDQLLEDIYQRACVQEKSQLKKLQYTYDASPFNIFLVHFVLIVLFTYVFTTISFYFLSFNIR